MAERGETTRDAANAKSTPGEGHVGEVSRQGSQAAGTQQGGDGLDWAARRRRRPHPPKMYRIGEVVSYSGLSRQTIHNYTTMGLLRESHWTPGGHRLYGPAVFDRLDEIAELKARGYTLARIRERFADKADSSAVG